MGTEAGPGSAIRVELPPHLRRLAGVEVEVRIEVDATADDMTLTQLLDALEDRFPVLVGTIRAPGSDRRRPLMRFFACGRDLSYQPPDTPLPREVVQGEEVLRIVGAIAGG